MHIYFSYAEAIRIRSTNRQHSFENLRSSHSHAQEWRGDGADFENAAAPFTKQNRFFYDCWIN